MRGGVLALPCGENSESTLPQRSRHTALLSIVIMLYIISQDLVILSLEIHMFDPLHLFHAPSTPYLWQLSILCI